MKFEKDKYESKIQRYIKIAKEAAEQSRRLMIPSISIEAELSAIKSDRASLKIIADEDDAGTTEKLYNLLDKTQISDSLSLLVGSEGGFERSEDCDGQCVWLYFNWVRQTYFTKRNSCYSSCWCGC